MPFRSMPRLAAVLSLMAGLSGCAVVELTAHGVKEWERRNQDGRQSASQSESQPQSPPRAEEEEPPPPSSAPAPRRSSVTVEELPAR